MSQLIHGNTKAFAAGVVAAIGAVVAVIILTAAVGAQPQDDHATAPVGVSALTRAGELKDALPRGFENLPAASHMADLDSARLLTSEDGLAYYVVSGMGDDLCLVSASGQDADLVSTGTCASRSAIVSSGLYFTDGPVDGPFRVAMLVPDGVTTVETADGTIPVSNNLALFTTDSTTDVRLRGGPFDNVVIALASRELPVEIEAG